MSLAGNDYYDLNDFVADSLKIPCSISCEIPHLGYLAGSSEDNLKEGTLIDLPFWLAAPLFADDFVQFYKTPKAYAKDAQNALQASATNMSLNAITETGFYFGGAVNLLQAVVIDGLPELLHEAFIARLAAIMNIRQMSHVQHFDSDHDFSNKLDEWENELYSSGFRAAQRTALWYNRMRSLK